MIGRAAGILTLVTATAIPATALAQAADTPATWVGIGMSWEHARFSDSAIHAWTPGDIGGMLPSLSLRVSRLVTPRVSAGVDIDISRWHENEVHNPVTMTIDRRLETFDLVVTFRDRFTTLTPYVAYSLASAGPWTMTASAGVSFTRSQNSFASAHVPPLPVPGSGRDGPSISVQIAVGPAVGLEVRRVLGERWSLFGDFRVTEVRGLGVSSRPQGFLLRPGFGVRFRL